MKLNGFDAYTLNGKGKVDGNFVDLGVILISAKKPVIVLGMGESEALKKHQAEVDGLIKSIRPAT